MENRGVMMLLLGVALFHVPVFCDSDSNNFRCKVCAGQVGVFNCARFSHCVIIKGGQIKMREIRLFSCKVKIVRIGWSQIQHPIIRDRMFRKCEDAPRISQPGETVTVAPTIQPGGTLKRTHAISQPGETVTIAPTMQLGGTLKRTHTCSVFTQDVPTNSQPGETVTLAPTIQPHGTMKRTHTCSVFTQDMNVQDNNNLFDEPGTAGFFSWALATSIAILLVIIKRLLFPKWRCHRCCMKPAQPQTTESLPLGQVPLNPAYMPEAMNLLHTPPSLASTPSTVTSSVPALSPQHPLTLASTPATVTSSAPLLSPQRDNDRVSDNTRSKSLKKKLIF